MPIPPPDRPRSVPSCPRRLPWLLSSCLLLAPLARAQENPPPASPPQEDAAELARRLAEALQRLEQLEQRLQQLEADERERVAEDDLEAQLRGLIEEPPPGAAPRTVFPSAYNPRIGVFMDAVAEAGDAQEDLDAEDGDRFSLRETEIDFRLPIAPFAEGVLIAVFEDEGGGEFESSVEEGYADVSVGALLDADVSTRARLGRFRVPFGHDNKLHTHDLLQVDRPLAVMRLLGEEGLIGDGVEFTQPLFHAGDEPGTGRTTTLQLAVVNGDVTSGHHSALGELAEDAGLELDSDAPTAVARLSHFMELSALSDLELGASGLRNLGDEAVTTDAGTEIEQQAYGVDATWRHRDDETGVGSWLLNGESIVTETDWGAATLPGVPFGEHTRRGWWLTGQRQLSPTTYLGLRYGKSDELGSDAVWRDLSPYVSWYPDEFFRIRLQGQHLHLSGADDEDVQRLFLQVTWNFGAHLPHPYWTNR